MIVIPKSSSPSPDSLSFVIEFYAFTLAVKWSGVEDDKTAQIFGEFSLFVVLL